MMRYVTLDCGTSTSRAYVVDGEGTVFAKATQAVGVRDTATSGSSEILRKGVRAIVSEAMASAGLAAGDVGAILSSGMITSEIGLCELPHLEAPVGLAELAKGVTRVPDAGIADPAIPVHFVRGIKNSRASLEGPATRQVGFLDFMRGEEAQMAGLMASPGFAPPAVAVVLSSHTKFVPLDAAGRVPGSITTLSGQLFDAIVNHTFVSKSCRRQPGQPERPEGYYDAEVVEHAFEWIRQVGLVRALMFPRFLDVLLDTAWYARALFLDALIAAEDMLALGQLEALAGGRTPRNFYLIGPSQRCRLYGDILARQLPGAELHCISGEGEVDALSIRGVLSLARRAGAI